MQFFERAIVADDEGDEADHCACDIGLAENEAISDAELPPAVGGVEAAADAPEDEEDFDGCEIDLGTADPTADEELPVTAGGL